MASTPAMHCRGGSGSWERKCQSSEGGREDERYGRGHLETDHWYEPLHELLTSLPSLSLIVLQPIRSQAPGREGQRAVRIPPTGAPSRAFWGSEVAWACNTGCYLLWSAWPHRAPQWLWQLPRKEESGNSHVWYILKQNNNWEIWWVLTGGRREWKRWNKDAILKLLARVQDFTIFYGKEQVKKFLLLMSIFLQSLRAKGFGASDFPPWGTCKPALWIT